MLAATNGCMISIRIRCRHNIRHRPLVVHLLYNNSRNRGRKW